MKFSNVFKTFSNSILLPNKGERHGPTFNSKEYLEMNEGNLNELEQLEDLLHASRKPVSTQKQETINVPNFRTPGLYEKVFGSGLFIDSASSTEDEIIIDDQPNIENYSYKRDVKSPTYYIPDTTYNSSNNSDYGGQSETNLENEKQRQYYSNKRRENKNNKENNFTITIMVPVNTTVQRNMDFARRKLVPTEKQVYNFYDVPSNRIEEISKEDNSSVLVIR